jgi:folylpolyglutamate synthase/dihydropteroate synthase
MSASVLAERLDGTLGAALDQAQQVEQACALAAAEARPGDRIIVSGSFAVAGPALAWLQKQTSTSPANLVE